MKTITGRASSVSGWHVPAIGFFLLGLLLGASFAVAGAVPGIRLLGALAAVSATLGIAIVGYSLRLEDPIAWSLLIQRLGSWRTRAADRLIRIRTSRRSYDRYWQNAVWSGMR